MLPLSFTHANADTCHVLNCVYIFVLSILWTSLYLKTFVCLSGLTPLITPVSFSCFPTANFFPLLPIGLPSSLIVICPLLVTVFCLNLLSIFRFFSLNFFVPKFFGTVVFFVPFILIVLLFFVCFLNLKVSSCWLVIFGLLMYFFSLICFSFFFFGILFFLIKNL